MERTTLGPVEQFCDSRKWFIGQRIKDHNGLNIYAGERADLVAFRLYDTGEIVLVDPARLEPNVPNPPKFSESAAWREMADAMGMLRDQ